MESQLHRPSHGHSPEENPQTNPGGLHSAAMEGDQVEHDHSGEKKSVLKKVKEKAKKIKETITKHGYGKHDEDVLEEEDEEEGEDMANETPIHGGTIHESTVIRSTNLPRQIDMNLDKPTDQKGEEMSTPPPLRKMEQELERPTIDASYPMNRGPIQREEENVGEQRVKIGPPMGLEEDPHSPKNYPGQIPPSNYQSKVVDPTGEGGKEADVTPLVSRFDKLNVLDEFETKNKPEQMSYTGSHDQFSPQPIPTKNEFKPEPNPVTAPENPDSSSKALDSSKPKDTITGKLSSATYAIADKAVSAKNMVASKLGYGAQETHTLETQDSPKKPVSKSAAEYAYKAVAPIYEKVAGAGTAVLSKVQGGGGGVPEHQGGDMEVKGTDKGVSVTEYLAEKFRPGDEDKALSEVITDALHKKKEGMQGQEQPIGKVTEFEDVAARLGTGLERKREGEGAFAAGSESSGGGVVERVNDAAGSWLGKSTGVQTAQDSIAKSYVSDEGSAPSGGVGGEASGGEKPKMQESGN